MEGGVLQIDESKEETTIRVRIFVIDGEMTVGSETNPFKAHLNLVLTGASSDQETDAIQKEVIGHGAGALPYSKVFMGAGGSTIKLHGIKKTPWVKLAQTAEKGSNKLILSQKPTGWKKGDQIVVPSTGMISGDETEVHQISDVQGNIIVTEKMLEHAHFGSSDADVRLHGEVGMLTHNIVIRGDCSDEDHKECTAAMKKSFTDEANMYNIRDKCYGGHTAFFAGGTYQVTNVEFRRMGQATRIARYPIHWHLAGNSEGNYVKDNSIHQAYQRCVTLHGSWGVQVEGNVCHDTYGHAFYLEDAIEHNNKFINNLAVRVRPGPMICTDSQVGPSGFWITNPNNTFVGNQVVDVGDERRGIGYWLVFGSEIDRDVGPTYITTDYWKEEEFEEKKAGLVFNPSQTVFKDKTWMINQQQGRTPFKKFSANGVRSSFRGVHIDGAVFSSVPGEVGEEQHDPEAISLFSGRDGTCNYFPAGKYAVPSAEGIHVYVPTEFSFDENGDAKGFKPAFSVMDGLHVSRCFETWWSRAARVNITNSLFAWNWVGMTNHIPGDSFCPGMGISTNPGLANNVINSLFIGHGDDAVNHMLCQSGDRAKASLESPAGIRQYDGAFWLHDSRWTNMSTVTCSGGEKIKSLPYALVSGRQLDCNGKFPVHLYNSWPLGASKSDSTGDWAWAAPEISTIQNLGQFSGTAVCERGPSGGVTDMTGTLGGPANPTGPVAYFAISGLRGQSNPGELAELDLIDLESERMRYGTLPLTQNAPVQSAAWYWQQQEDPDYAHQCGYCFYDEQPNGCPRGPSDTINGTFPSWLI